MVKETMVYDENVAKATNSIVGYDDVQCSAEPMCWFSVVQYQSKAVDQQAQLIGVVIIIAFKANAEKADNEDCNAIENGD